MILHPGLLHCSIAYAALAVVSILLRRFRGLQRAVWINMKTGGIKCFALAASVLLSLTPAHGHGQVAEAGPTYEVRLTYRCPAAVSAGGVCSVRGTTPDVVVPESLVITPSDGKQLAVRLADVIRLEERAGTRSRWAEGAVAGFVIGASATLLTMGGAFSDGSLCDYTRDQDAMGWPGCVGVAAGVGVVTGALGGIVGSRLKVARWRRIDPVRDARTR